MSESEFQGINLNFGGITPSVFLEKEGKFTFEVVDMAFQPAKTQGKFPQIYIDFSVFEPVEDYGARIRSYFSLSPKALGFIQAFLEAATGEEWRSDDMRITRDIIGLFVVGYVFDDTQPGTFDPVKGITTAIKHNYKIKNFARWTSGSDATPTTDYSSMANAFSGFFDTKPADDPIGSNEEPF